MATEMIQERLERLESEIGSVQILQTEISHAITKSNETLSSVAATLVKVQQSIDSSKEFQIRIEEARKADSAEFHRLARRIDGIQTALNESRAGLSAEIDAVWHAYRKQDKNIRDEMHAIDKQLALTGRGAEATESGVQKIQVKAWQVIFWALTAQVLYAVGNGGG